MVEKNDPPKIDPELAEQLTKLQRNIARTLEPLKESMAKASEHARLLHERVQRVLLPFQDILNEMERDNRFIDSGWVPHVMLPLDEWSMYSKEPGFDTDKFVIDFFHDNWQFVKHSLSNNPAFDLLGNETAETYRQALLAHEAGLYRCVPRTLFAEIELAENVALRGVTRTNRINARLKPVWALLDELPVTVLPKEIRSVVPLLKIQEIAYADSRRKPVDSKLPNRNEFIHGYGLRHATEQDSINALLIADLMFRLLATVKSIVDEERQQQVSDVG